MHGSQNIKTVNLVINADPGGTDEIFYVMKAPQEITILGGHVIVEQTQNAGTAIQARLENWGTAGTAVEGTISAYLGGTAAASRLTARTPAAMTIDPAQDYLDSGDWIVARFGEEGSGWITGDRLQLTFRYVDGVGA